MVNLFGLMEDATKETGKMENNMEKVYMLLVKEPKDMANGEMENELDGLEEMEENNEAYTLNIYVYIYK